MVGAPPFASVALTPPALLQGLAGAVGLVALLSLFQVSLPQIARQAAATSVELMRRANLKLTWPMILAMSVAAGLCEEALFRGVLQVWAERALPLWAAILLPAMVFSLLHFYSVLYVLLVFPIALFLGILFAWTDNLLVAMLTHALYDVYGLWNVRQAMTREDRAV